MNPEEKDFYKKIRKKINDWLESNTGKNKQWSEYILLAPDLFHLLTKLSIDKELPESKKVKLYAAIAYFISPIDLLPEAFFGPVGFLDDIALSAYVFGDLALAAAAKGADVAADSRTKAARPAFLTDAAWRHGRRGRGSGRTLSYHWSVMARTDLYFKVEVEHDAEERLERMVSEIERQLRKLYVVRSVEFSNAVRRDEQ